MSDMANNDLEKYAKALDKYEMSFFPHLDAGIHESILAQS